VELSPERARRLSENLARLRLTADIAVGDAAAYAGAPAAAVLLDAPCSATGTIRRRPDIPWAKRAEDIRALCEAQDRLIDAAARLTAPGGTLVYAVCSLQDEEGPARIDAFLRRRGDWRRAPIGAAEIPGIAEFLTPKGELRTLPSHWPERGGLDGFYVARLTAPA
jgi:16S rRNA (cytosine967-C5)-methyltransferase